MVGGRCTTKPINGDRATGLDASCASPVGMSAETYAGNLAYGNVLHKTDTSNRRNARTVEGAARRTRIAQGAGEV